MNKIPAHLAKFGLLGVLGLGLALALLHFDAASAALRAHASARAIVMADGVLTPSAKAEALAEARAILDQAASAPLTWRPDAAETQSWIASQQALAGADSLADAQALARLAVRLDPNQAVSYQRLAAFALRGQPNPICAPRDCLLRAFAASPMAPEPIACDRLRLADLAGIEFRADDPRLANYLALQPSPARLRECLGFLDAATLYGALVRARAAGRF
jgi:hypothetical protein